MKARSFAVAFALMTLAACGDDSEPTDYVTVYSQGLDQMGGQVSVRVEQSNRTDTFSQAQLVEAAKRYPYGITLPTQKSGNIRVSFALVGSSNDTISVANIELPLTKGNIYGASLQRWPANFHDICLSCSGIAKFPIHDTKKPTTDSLWLYYSAAPPLCKGCVI